MTIGSCCWCRRRSAAASAATDRSCGTGADGGRDSGADAGADADAGGADAGSAWDPCTWRLLQRLLCWMPAVVAVAAGGV